MMAGFSTPFDPDWVPLLVPDMPSPQALLPWLERMHVARQYSNFGPLVRELEVAFSRIFAVPQGNITTVSNATQGLELVLQALELPEGSHVLVPAFTFVATATAVVRAGHVPVLADVDAKTWMLTPDIARTACANMRIDAVMPVATFGMPYDMQAWQRFEVETGLPVVIDAAAAYGSQWLQDAQCTLVFSLHTTKSLPAGEGGLVVSTRPGLAAKVRQLSNFGINLDPFASLPVGSLADLGTNAKMSEYHGAIGLASLQVWESHAQKRRELQINLIHDLNLASGQRLAWQAQGTGGPLMAPALLCARFPSEGARIAVEHACAQARIMTRRWYQPLLSNMAVLSKRCHQLPVTNAQVLGECLLGLPFFLGIEQQEVQRIVQVLKEIDDSMWL